MSTLRVGGWCHESHLFVIPGPDTFGLVAYFKVGQFTSSVLKPYLWHAHPALQRKLPLWVSGMEVAHPACSARGLAKGPSSSSCPGGDHLQASLAFLLPTPPLLSFSPLHPRLFNNLSASRLSSTVLGPRESKTNRTTHIHIQRDSGLLGK